MRKRAVNVGTIVLLALAIATRVELAGAQAERT
jgi:hypothetical protein